MALNRVNNVVYATAADRLAGRLLIVGVVMTSTAANAVMNIFDDNTGAPAVANTVLQARIAAADETRFFDLSLIPIRIEDALNIGTLTNAAVTVIIKEMGSV